MEMAFPHYPLDWQEPTKRRLSRPVDDSKLSGEGGLTVFCFLHALLGWASRIHSLCNTLPLTLVTRAHGHFRAVEPAAV